MCRAHVIKRYRGTIVRARGSSDTSSTKLRKLGAVEAKDLIKHAKEK